MTRISDPVIVLYLFLSLLLATTACIADSGFPKPDSLNTTTVSQNTNNSLNNPFAAQNAMNPSRIIAISTSNTHNLALRENGTITVWDDVKDRQYCTNGACDIPGNLTDVTAIAAGEGFSAALTKGGNVVVWGCRWNPMPGIEYHVPQFETDAMNPCRVPANLTQVRSISASRSHILAIREDGTVTAWGYNDKGQCNVPSGLKNVTKVYAGDGISMALKDDGSVTTWGWYTRTVPEEPAYIGFAAAYPHGLLLTDNGTLTGFRDPETYDRPWESICRPDLTNVTAVSAGDRNFVALLENKTVIFWTDSKTSSWKPWGDVTGLHNVTAISSQGWSNLALKDDGTIVQWGF
jgi:alpha-tubulin suppressor-like RCC1 family protein